MKLHRSGPTRIGMLALLAALAACGETTHKLAAIEPTADTACALDGMILKDFAGPKAQIHYTEGKPDLFCDLRELFGVVLSPEHKRVAAAIFVQDMGKADWDHPQGNWIDARTAIYVIGSRKHGSMGPAFGSFATADEAEAFVKNNGGRIVRFNEVTLDMVNMAGGTHDDRMS